MTRPGVLLSLSLASIAWMSFPPGLHGQQKSSLSWPIPRTWDGNSIRTLELPLAHAEASPMHVSAGYDYRIPEAGSKQTLSIHLYDEAEVNARTLRWAIAQANRLFRMADIQISWHQVSGKPIQSPEMDNGGVGCPQTNQRPYIAMVAIRRRASTTGAQRW